MHATSLRQCCHAATPATDPRRKQSRLLRYEISSYATPDQIIRRLPVQHPYTHGGVSALPLRRQQKVDHILLDCSANHEDPVGIESIECAIIDRGFDMGWMIPTAPPVRTGKKVAVISSNPADMATADRLNRDSHLVTVYVRAGCPGGLLMYGIRNTKLDMPTSAPRRPRHKASTTTRYDISHRS